MLAAFVFIKNKSKIRIKTTINWDKIVITGAIDKFTTKLASDNIFLDKSEV